MALTGRSVPTQTSMRGYGARCSEIRPMSQRHRCDKIHIVACMEQSGRNVATHYAVTPAYYTNDILISLQIPVSRQSCVKGCPLEQALQVFCCHKGKHHSPKILRKDGFGAYLLCGAGTVATGLTIASRLECHLTRAKCRSVFPLSLMMSSRRTQRK